MTSGPERDLVGYGPSPPDAAWPGGAPLALNFVLNVEEGSEPSIDDGDGYTEEEGDCDDGDDACTIDTCDDDGFCNYTHICDECTPSSANMLVLLDFSGSMDGASSPGANT